MSDYYTESQVNRIEEDAYNGAIFEAGKEWERQRDEFNSREHELQSRIAKLEESMSNWVNVDDQPFPDKDGLIVCWDGQVYTTFYFQVDWTVTLPFGTKCWYLLPLPFTLKADK